MPDYYPQEKGSIRRDRVGEFRDLMAKKQLGMMPIGGMAAKMSKPAVDVLSRWIRRYRKGKAPTVPSKQIEKALENEEARTLGIGRPGPSQRSYKPLIKYNEWPHHPDTKEYFDELKESGDRITEIEYYLSQGGRGHGELAGRPKAIGFEEKSHMSMIEDFLMQLNDMYNPKK